MTQETEVASERSRRLYRCLSGTALATVIAFTTGAHAQQSSNTGAQAQGSSTGLEEIVVTARKKKEKLQDAPISVSVRTGATLQEQNISSLNDLSQTEPSVKIMPAGRGDRLTVRGSSTGSNASLDQAVPTFDDDVYHGRSRMSSGLFLDVDRVEILKGPQTTYFGNNAIGGAINVVTRRPDDQWGGYVRTYYGSDNEYAAEGALNVPVSEVFDVRAAAIADGIPDGYLHDPVGGNTPRTENVSGRIWALWKPSDDFNLSLKAESGSSHIRGALTTQPTNCPPASPYRVGPFCSALIKAGSNTQLDNEREQAPGQLTKLSNSDFVAVANYDSSIGTFTSETAYSHYGYDLKLNTAQTATPLFNNSFPEHQSQFSQELRWTSKLEGPLEFTAGAYYQNSRLFAGNDFVYFFLQPNLVGPFASLKPGPFSQDLNSNQHERDYSAFASGTWHIMDDLSATVSGRWTDTKKSFFLTNAFGTSVGSYGEVIVPYSTPALIGAAQALSNALGLGKVGSINLSRSDSDVTPAADIQYKLTPDINIYASYTRGFLAGGFNGADTSFNASLIPFNPEHVDAYEAGVKSLLLDHRLMVNLALFYEEFSDLQVAAQQYSGAALITNIRNAAQATSRGLDAEVRAIVTDRLSVGTKFTVLDAYFGTYTNAAPYAALKFAQPTNQVQDASGKDLPYSPRFSGSLDVTYVQPVSADLDLTLDVMPYFSTSFYTTDTLDPAVKQSAYATLDFRLTLVNNSSDWELSFIGKNVTSTTVKNLVIDLPLNTGSYTQSKQRPASFGVQFVKHW